MNTNAGSLNTPVYSDKTSGRGRGGSRDLTVAHATAISPRKMNAVMRIVHGNPTRGISLTIMMGITKPPIEDPLTMMPNAAARRRKNHVTTLAMGALKHADDATAAQRLCARKNW